MIKIFEQFKKKFVGLLFKAYRNKKYIGTFEIISEPVIRENRFYDYFFIDFSIRNILKIKNETPPHLEEDPYGEEEWDDDKLNPIYFDRCIILLFDAPFDRENENEEEFIRKGIAYEGFLSIGSNRLNSYYRIKFHDMDIFFEILDKLDIEYNDFLINKMRK